ncbi:hypothetical protein BGZ99_007821 [Dissophora globulifera]|uniref:Uncharacterized protein n=1 Tax=Dissophora globulifera TaxID=979702 RepID=A0A9P6RUB0_9FUNG|nr:hypothetical protein BGZ99_007821 [Dissophora globulifera]
MTHLSDYSYIQRALSTAWFYGWFVIYIWRWDRFDALRLRRLMRFELRSVGTLLVIIALALQLSYDVGSARLKYIEGFWINPLTKEVQSKPAQFWSPADVSHVEPLYYTLAMALAFENSVMFLLMGFWNYISKSVTKSSFMSSFEFKFNIICSCLAIVIFPTVQFVFRKDFVYREAVPQLLFSILTFVTASMGVRTHFRLKALIKSAHALGNESTYKVVKKLQYFVDMNVILTFSLFGTSIPLGILSVDGMLDRPVINLNKFASDFLIANLNFFEFIIWVTFTLIFYPRKSGTESPFGPSSNSDEHRPSSYNASLESDSRDAYPPKFNDVKPHEFDLYRKPDPIHDIENPVWNPHDTLTIAPRTQHAYTFDGRPAPYIPIVMSTASPTVANSVPALAASSASPISGTIPAPVKATSQTKKPMQTSTIYYQEGLARAAQAQQLPLESGSIADPSASTSAIPNAHSFSNHQGNQHSSSDEQQQQRNGSTGGQRPLVTKPKHPSRALSGSMDYRGANWATSSQNDLNQTISSGSARQQSQQPSYQDAPARAISPLVPGTERDEAIMSLQAQIQQLQYQFAQQQQQFQQQQQQQLSPRRIHQGRTSNSSNSPRT